MKFHSPGVARGGRWHFLVVLRLKMPAHKVISMNSSARSSSCFHLVEKPILMSGRSEGIAGGQQPFVRPAEELIGAVHSKT